MEGKAPDDPFFDLRTEIKSEENTKKIIGGLKIIITDGDDFNQDLVEALTLLLEHEDFEVKYMTAHAIAELCKCDKKRIKYGQSAIVDRLLKLLKEPLNRYNSELMKHTCRALGNICYDNYVGRDLILNADGIGTIVELLPKSLDCDKLDIYKTCRNVRMYACKLLMILFLGGADYIKPALDADFLKKDQSIIKYEYENPNEDSEERLHTAISIMNIVVEYNRSMIMEDDLTLVIVDILKNIVNCEISEVCLEYLHYQADHDDVKTLLAKENLPQSLWALIERYITLAVDDITKELKKLSCDLIALILTGDEAMDHLYNDGKGEFYLKMMDCLDLPDVELAITAILAAGNFARSDRHCFHMMDTGVFKKLMSILLLHKNHEDDIRLQHVVLSGLRNLTIPRRNKPLAIEHGVLPLLVEMVSNVTQYHVVFKLLATLRMLVDGQEAVAEQVVNANILDRISKWGLQNEHAGVSGEASRLLARTVRQLQSRELCVKILKTEGCISCLVTMMNTIHPIMQNEAIISLSILYVTCLFRHNAVPMKEVNNTEDAGQLTPLDDEVSRNEYDDDEKLIIKQLSEANLSEGLVNLIEKNMSMQKEIADNLIKFILLLTKNDELKEQLLVKGLQTNLNKLKLENANLSDTIKKSIDEILQDIDEKHEETTM